MAVDAVASVVLQKLRDLLLEESITKNKAIGCQLEQMQKALNQMRGFFMDAAERETNNKKIKIWTNDYLVHLYSVEDSIELFALRITRQRKRLGFLMNHALFLKKFTAFKMLSIKLHRTQSKIKKLNSRKPNGLEDASLRSIRSQQIESSPRSVGRVDEDEDAGKHEVEQVMEQSSNIRCANGSPAVPTKQGSPINLPSESFKRLSRSDTSLTQDNLMLSYNDLDAHLKLCLIYMTLFPKESNIPVRRLQRLWLAEGFVKRPQNKDKFQEDVAQEYFENLVNCSLIVVSKLCSDGSPRKCHLLGALHDFLLANARDISLFHVHGGSNSDEDGPSGKRRLIEYADGKNCTLQSSEYQHLRSYISFNLQKKDTPAKYVGTLVSNMIGKGLGLLRVLDLEGVYKPSLPENLGDLFHLKYLGLRWTFLDKLPKSVGQLPYLETLDLKHTYINRIPPSIWKLKHLRHLNLNEVHLDKDTPLHLRNSLPKLLTLWGLSVNHESPVKNGLSKLNHLRELGISFRLSKYDDDTNEGSKSALQTQFTYLVDWISKLTALRSLRLRSKDDSGCPEDLSLVSFSGLEELSQMNLFGKLQKLPDMDQFPPHIKVLTLSVSNLKQDPMPILGQLPDLTVLRLLANSYLEEKMVCSTGTFKNLEVLKLWKLEKLKEWEVEEGAMTKLKELNIRCCSKLENIPSRLLQQNTFKDLILNNMPPGFKENVEKNNQCNVIITVNDYEF